MLRVLCRRVAARTSSTGKAMRGSSRQEAARDLGRGLWHAALVGKWDGNGERRAEAMDWGGCERSVGTGRQTQRASNPLGGPCQLIT